jgi:hypothetical protein
MSRLQTAFGLLILAQAAHSAEECLGRLWESFPPARLVSGLISDDLGLGFVFVNVVLVSFGLWCWAMPIRREWPSALPLACGWVVLEGVNGIGHAVWSVRQGGYTPGVATAPLLLVLVIHLARQLSRAERHAPGAP